MLPDIEEAEIWRQLFALAERAQPVITRHTVCLYVWQEKIKKLAVAGTGVLLRVGSRHFLLSAAHVVDLAFNFNMPLVAQPNKDPIRPITLLFVARRSSIPPPGIADNDPALRDGDALDISLAELTNETAEKLANRYRFLSLSDLDPFPPRIADGMYVFGYPAALAKPGDGDVELENWPLGYVTTLIQKEPEERDKDKEILLYYSLQSTDGKGGRVNAPAPQGFSGCGIWRLSRAPVHPSDSSIADMRLIGIQHRWRPKSHYLVGTTVRHFLDMLWGCYPDLRPSLAIWRRI